MVLPANSAFVYTTTTIASRAAFAVQREIGNCEEKIRGATGLGFFDIVYNATILGNPNGPPQHATNLTDNQQTFYNLLINAGYLVDLDIDTGRWLIKWSPTGPEAQVNVYSFRTTVNPAGISAQTITTIENYFLALIPTVHSLVVLDNILPEADFGGSGTTFYEYTIVVDQIFDNTDFSAILKAVLLVQSLGYTGLNCQVFKLL